MVSFEDNERKKDKQANQILDCENRMKGLDKRIRSLRSVGLRCDHLIIEYQKVYDRYRLLLAKMESQAT